MTDAIAWIRDLGTPGIIVFFVVFVVNTSLALPSTHFYVAAGLLYSIWGGTLIMTIGSVVVELVVLLLFRTKARGWLERKAKRHEKLAALDRAVSNESHRSFLVLWLLRVSPIVPFGVANYVLAPVRISLHRRLAANVLGMGPCSLAQAYAGSMVATLGGLSDAGPQGPWKWIVFGLGVVLVAVALIITTRATKRVLASSGG